ncbi:MAG: hypothetical protein HQK49_17125 [Oligoflexia bacterium]|nr:hypothetical protein [Oligoflexia bacterium]
MMTNKILVRPSFNLLAFKFYRPGNNSGASTTTRRYYMFSKFMSMVLSLSRGMFSISEISQRSQQQQQFEKDHLQELRELSLRYSVPVGEHRKMFLVG